ncbi:MAG TPA: HD-GYP domain-containing protein [Myxococcales bacterium]|nr:HD-GYP domain-containing protein [Myxococcales bacterium]
MSDPKTTPPGGLETPLLVHDRSLTQKVGQGSEAAEIVDQQVQRIGTQLVTQLGILLRMVRSHGVANAALDRPVSAILTLLRALGQDNTVELRVQEDFVFLGDRYLRAPAHQLPLLSSFIDMLGSMGVGGVLLSLDVTDPDLRKFAGIFAAAEPGPETLDDLREELLAAEITSIALDEPRRARKDAAPPAGAIGDLSAKSGTAAPAADARQSKDHRRARSVYSNAGGALASLDHAARTSGTINLRQARRALQNIVDLLLKDPVTVLSLSTLRAHDEYTQNHSVNVALLSMTLANRVGYSKVELAELGLAALFHDIGKCAVSLDILNKPGNFTGEEWDVMRTHPSEGVLKLINSRGIGKVPARMAAAAFEHHMNADLSGYPKLKVPWRMTLASRVVAIADCYDAMTSARVYRREPLSPPAVLKFMMEKAGSAFDPILLKYFVTCVGIIPLGSLVLLDSGELAVVLRPAQEKDESGRPVVRLICDTAGTPLEPPVDADLRETDAQGRHLRSIVRLVDNTEYRLETSRYLA